MNTRIKITILATLFLMLLSTTFATEQKTKQVFMIYAGIPYIMPSEANMLENNIGYTLGMEFGKSDTSAMATISVTKFRSFTAGEYSDIYRNEYFIFGGLRFTDGRFMVMPGVIIRTQVDETDFFAGFSIGLKLLEDKRALLSTRGGIITRFKDDNYFHIGIYLGYKLGS